MARKLDEEKRKGILAAALQTFGERGFTQATIKEIAATAHIAPGTLYTYFSNKDELFAAAVDDIWSRFVSSMRNVSLEDKPFFDKLLAFIDFGFGLLEAVHPLLRGMFSEANRRELLIERVDEFCALISVFFDDARAAGIAFSATSNEELRRFNLRLIVSGILFRIALAPPEELNAELGDIRRGLVLGIRDRL